MSKPLVKGLPIFAVAMNMRAGLILIGRLLPILQKQYHISTFMESVLASAPLICFSLTALFVGNLVRKRSTNQIITYAVTLLTLSLICRTLFGITSFLIFSITLGICVAILNYMLPVWVRENNEGGVGLITGTYAAIMATCSAISLAITVPLANATSWGWRLALIPWFVIGFFTTLWWWGKGNKNNQVADATAAPTLKQSGIARNLDAWALTIFFGLLNMIHYASATWLPTVLISKGFAIANSGFVVAIATLTGALLSQLVPHYASRGKDFRAVLVGFSLILALAYLGISIDKGARLIIWVILANIGVYVTFSLALFLVVHKSSSADNTKLLSLMAQCVGYLMATTSPLIFGGIYSASHHWSNSVIYLVVLALIQVLISLRLGKDRKI